MQTVDARTTEEGTSPSKHRPFPPSINDALDLLSSAHFSSAPRQPAHDLPRRHRREPPTPPPPARTLHSTTLPQAPAPYRENRRFCEENFLPEPRKPPSFSHKPAPKHEVIVTAWPWRYGLSWIAPPSRPHLLSRADRLTEHRGSAKRSADVMRRMKAERSGSVAGAGFVTR
jgi:hypothetical protein